MRPIVKDDTRTVQDVKTNVPFSGDRCSFCSRRNCFFGKNGETPLLKRVSSKTRSSEDSKDPDVEQAHQRTRRLVVETNTENVPDRCPTRSCHESETFKVGDKTLRERTGRPVVNHDDSSHEQTMLNEVNMDFEFQDYHILL